MVSIGIELPRCSEIRVSDAELARLISWPRGRAFEGETLRLVLVARAMFENAAAPWMHARMLNIAGVQPSAVRLADGVTLPGGSLARMASQAQCMALLALAVTAGPEISSKLDQLWAADSADLAFVLSSLCSAYVEQAIIATHARICRWANPRGLAVLPPMSPGNADWELSAQGELFRLIRDDPDRSGVMPIDMLDSGCLSPSASQLAVFGLTCRLDLVRDEDVSQPCTRCTLRGCAYRRRDHVLESAIV